MSTTPKSKSTYIMTRWIFIRWMAVMYLAAFSSLIGQITGFYGTDGIIPLSRVVAAWHEAGQTFLTAPSIFWLNTGDTMLTGVCAAGKMVA